MSLCAPLLSLSLLCLYVAYGVTRRHGASVPPIGAKLAITPDRCNDAGDYRAGMRRSVYRILNYIFPNRDRPSLRGHISPAQ